MPGSLWNNAEIRVCWEEPRQRHRTDREWIRRAIRMTWEKESAVRFVGWGKCRQGDHGIRIMIANHAPHTRALGRALDGLESGMSLLPVSVSRSASLHLWMAVHEFGHALGFIHEYQRSDIAQRPECLVPDRIEAERAVLTGGSPLTEFDESSVMVACAADVMRRFSTGIPHLSDLDIEGVVAAYGPSRKNDRGGRLH